MNNTFIIFLIVFGGVFSVTVIATAGSVLSRKFNFNYSLLSVLSIIVYVLVSYFILQKHNFVFALLSCNAVGLYDSTFGWELCKKFKANFGKLVEDPDKINLHFRILSMIFFSSLCAVVGYWIS